MVKRKIIYVLDIAREIIVLIEATAVLVHNSEEEALKGGFEGAFPCFQAVVVVELTAFQPESTLAVTDDVSNNFPFVAPPAAAARVA